MINRKKRQIAALTLALALLLSGCAGPNVNAPEEGGTRSFTDSSGRTVELPETLNRIAPSGSIATMILATIAPEYFVCIHSGVDEQKAAFLPDSLDGLPETGQLFGGKGDLNKEALLAAEPQVIIDIGDPKDGMKEDLDALQEQTGIPVVFIEGDLAHLADAYRTLGTLLGGKQERGEQLAAFVEETLAMAQKNSAAVTEQNRKTVMYVTGNDGVNTNAQGSTQMQVLDLVGAQNAVILEEVSNKGGGNTISMEQVYRFAPDVLLFSAGSYYDTASGDPVWSVLSAVSENRFYEIPEGPYSWLCAPTSVNMLLGVWWLGNLLYPDVYAYDMTAKAQEIYSLLWGYTLSDQQAQDMLSRSTLR